MDVGIEISDQTFSERTELIILPLDTAVYLISVFHVTFSCADKFTSGSFPVITTRVAVDQKNLWARNLWLYIDFDDQFRYIDCKSTLKSDRSGLEDA